MTAGSNCTNKDIGHLKAMCMQVEEITLNATIVKRSDGGRMWYSNTKLAASNVINITRSDNKSETLKVPHLCNQDQCHASRVYP